MSVADDSCGSCRSGARQACRFMSSMQGRGCCRHACALSSTSLSVTLQKSWDPSRRKLYAHGPVKVSSIGAKSLHLKFAENGGQLRTSEIVIASALYALVKLRLGATSKRVWLRLVYVSDEMPLLRS